MADEEIMLVELFVQGQSAYSAAALERVRRICETELRRAYRLEVIDVHQNPERATLAGVIATPALVRSSPGPVLRTIGRLSDERVREGLGL
ncbi:circadian clock protein KaiB [Proteobacteria bacterium 005FR1]|nr:circadian clock protein KaiB [Proteobacteria bacterium 005FR1]